MFAEWPVTEGHVVSVTGTESGTGIMYDFEDGGRRPGGVSSLKQRSPAGLSRAQVTRPIAGYAGSGRLRVALYQWKKFAKRYSRAGVELLSYVGKGPGNRSGPATKRILEREHSEYGQAAGPGPPRLSAHRRAGGLTRFSVILEVDREIGVVVVRAFRRILQKFPTLEVADAEAKVEMAG